MTSLLALLVKVAVNPDFRFDHPLRTLGMRRYLFCRGFARDHDGAEAGTQWVRQQAGLFRPPFNAALKVELQGSRVTSDGGLFLVREPGETGRDDRR